MRQLPEPACATAVMLFHVIAADAQTIVTMHKACAVGTLGRAYVEGTCEFTAEPGYEIVPGSVTFGWRPYREPTKDCAGSVVFDPPEVRRDRILVHAHASQRGGQDCGGVMDYHIETAAISAPPPVGSSSEPPRPPDP